MQPIQLFELASRQAEWLSVRQEVVATNSVALAEEMTKTGEIKRQYELNANLVKSFHRMMLMTVKR